MAAMTVLPSFQAFLQSATAPRSPTSGSPLRSPSQFASPTASFYPQATLSPLSWAAAADRLCSGGLSDEDDSMDGRFAAIRPAAHGLKRRLGSDACSSPERSAIVNANATAGKRVKKKYLKERERCEIVRRVRAGEKQAHLAKEFGVSRAAVCYLLKHQLEILRRSSERL